LHFEELTMPLAHAARTHARPRARTLSLLALGCLAPFAHAADIVGAGATFPAPLYAKWAEAYKTKSGIGLNYQSIGSGGGISQIKAGTVTFGASDMPLKPEDLNKAGLVQFPMIIGGVVPVINLPGVAPGALVLDGATLASIYLGEIKQWNDPRIRKLNPRVTLPATAIAPVYRADGSGTNFLFTDYLSKQSPAFKSSIGAATSVDWPTGIGAKGNEGVANMTKQTVGAICYVEFAYAKQNNMTYVDLVNHDGKPVAPTEAAFAAAADRADWAHAENYYLILTDQPGADSWPITGASFILMYRQPRDPAAAKQALDFFGWALGNGGATAETLAYVPLPASLIRQVEQTWTKTIQSAGKPVWTAP
jgi:phosphate transport system substrate-binding protein